MSRFCKSCDICQRIIQKGRVTKVPLGKLPLIDTPFKRVAVDIVGPIQPRSERKSRYILSMIDYATRYPEAVALPGIEVSRLLSLQQITTMPYHPICNGLTECFHMTLKLRRMYAERPKDWDKYLPALLFAIREVPHESLGFRRLSCCTDVTLKAQWQYYVNCGPEKHRINKFYRRTST